MNRTTEIILVVVYNLILLAGASYLVVVHDFSPWIYLMTLMFGASWKEDPKVTVEAGK